jgi:hypothetical protein
MDLSFPTGAQVAAFSRHIATFAAGAVTVGVGLHFISPDQGTQIGNAVSGIINGVESIIGGIATLIAIGSGVYAAWTASPTSQIKAVVANPDVSKVVTTPAVAATVPGDKVVSK